MALYANIDEFTYAEDDIPLKDRPEIDQWILSELHTLIKLVDESYADYEATKAARLISEFVQEKFEQLVCSSKQKTFLERRLSAGQDFRVPNLVHLFGNGGQAICARGSFLYGKIVQGLNCKYPKGEF